MAEGLSPIFIHSLFRSGSTYIFQVFRRAGPGRYYCYQEPLHEQVAQLPDHAHQVALTNQEQHEDLRHPALEQDYFHEFLPVRETIRHTFSTDFSYDQFFLNDEASAPELKTYLACLLRYGGPQSVLQFCRSTGRIGWLRRHFDAVHLYLLRNPWDQWWSYRAKPYFETTIRLILSGPAIPSPIQAAAAEAGIIPAPPGPLADRMRHHNAVPYCAEQSYLGFYALWLYSLIEAVRSSDLILAMDQLSSSDRYRKQRVGQLEALGAVDLDFSDCNLPRRHFSDQDAHFFRDIEAQVQRLFLANGTTCQTLDKALAVAAEQGCQPLLDVGYQPRFPNAATVRQQLEDWIAAHIGRADSPIPATQSVTFPLCLPCFPEPGASLRSLLRLPPNGFVYGAYKRLLRRTPDADGFRHYRHELRRGRTRLSILWELLRSAEAGWLRSNSRSALHFLVAPPADDIATDWNMLATQLVACTPKHGCDGHSLILVLNYYPVAKTPSGGAEKIRALLGHLSARHPVVLVTLGDGAEASAIRLSSTFTEINLPLTLAQALREAALYRGLRQWSLCRTAAQHPLLLALIRLFLDRDAIVILSHPYLAPAAAACGANRVIYDSHNAEYLLAEALQFPRLAQRDIARCERQALSMARFATAVSDIDRIALAEIAPRTLPIYTLPIGSTRSVPSYKSGTLDALKQSLFGDRKVVIFVGNDYPPNLQAADYLLGHLAPLLADVAVFLVVGSVCEPLDHQPHFGNVLLLGQVETLVKETVYAMTDVALDPITSGSDANVKLAEYLARGLSVLTTPFGARGFELTDGRQAMIRDRAEFPQALRALLSSPALRQTLAQEGAAFAEAQLNWSRIADRFADHLAEHFGEPRRT